MRRQHRRATCAALLLCVTLIWFGAALPALAHGSSTRPVAPGVLRQLVRVRAATFKYRDVNVALAEGYAPIPIKGAWCVEHPTDGAMGIHYLNPALVDGTLDPLRPELLLYFPTANGLRLVGVEYFIPDSGQPHPTLFSRPLDGPNSTLEPEIPRHYSLHAWVWFGNPSGVFSGYNPRLDCA
jgi:hypothetical protein